LRAWFRRVTMCRRLRRRWWCGRRAWRRRRWCGDTHGSAGAAACYFLLRSQLLNSTLRTYYEVAIIMGSSQLPIIVYVTIARWLVMAAAARALMRGNVIVSVPVRVGDSLLGILGNGDARIYPLGRFPTQRQQQQPAYQKANMMAPMMMPSQMAQQFITPQMMAPAQMPMMQQQPMQQQQMMAPPQQMMAPMMQAYPAAQQQQQGGQQAGQQQQYAGFGVGTQMGKNF
jgi:hypothetical protein